MVDDTVDLDSRRGMAAQKATDLRRLVREVADEHARLKAGQDELHGALIEDLLNDIERLLARTETETERD